MLGKTVNQWSARQVSIVAKHVRGRIEPDDESGNGSQRLDRSARPTCHIEHSMKGVSLRECDEPLNGQRMKVWAASVVLFRTGVEEGIHLIPAVRALAHYERGD